MKGESFPPLPPCPSLPHPLFPSLLLSFLSFPPPSHILSPQEQDTAAEAEENVQRLVVKKADLEAHIQELVERLDEEVENNANIATARRRLEAEVERSKEDCDDLRQQLDLVGSQYYMYHVQYTT